MQHQKDSQVEKSHLEYFQTVNKVEVIMSAPKGNQFWKVRAKHGRDKIFKTPEMLWDACCEYFDWTHENPLEKAIVYQGEVSKDTEKLMRAMTISGLCIFLGTHSEYFTSFESDLDLDTDEGKDFSRVTKKVREIITTQKFEGASAGLLNANIIARDLGLSDKQSVEAVVITKKSFNDFYED